MPPPDAAAVDGLCGRRPSALPSFGLPRRQGDKRRHHGPRAPHRRALPRYPGQIASLNRLGPAAARPQGVAQSPDVAQEHHSLALRLPSLRSSLRHALPSLIEGVVGPALVFYLALLLGGYRPAIVAALCWTTAVLLRRLVRKKRVPAVVLLGAALLVLRSIVAYLTGSSFLYFVQPAAGTVVVGVAFLVSAISGRPLTERFAHDFCPLDRELTARPFVRRYFSRIAVLWGAILLVNAGIGLWLLLSASLSSFVLVRSVATWGLDGTGVALSAWWFIRLMRRHGIHISWHGQPAGAAPAADGAATVSD